MEKSSEEYVILSVLAGQTAGYLILPTATAFLVEGLEPGSAEAVLFLLEEQGLAAHLTTNLTEIQMHPTVDENGEPTGLFEPVELPVVDDSGQPIVMMSGWHITEEGRAAVASVE